MQSISVFLDIAKFADFQWKNADVSRTQGCVTWFIYFLDLLRVRYNCANFHHCRICVTDLREGGPFWPPAIREQPRKSSSWIRLKNTSSGCFCNKGDGTKAFPFFIWLMDSLTLTLSVKLGTWHKPFLSHGHSSVQKLLMTFRSYYLILITGC